MAISLGVWGSLNSRYDPCDSPTLTWIKRRTAAGFAFLAPLTALAPAHAGGDPGYPVGGVTVDERAT